MYGLAQWQPKSVDIDQAVFNLLGQLFALIRRLLAAGPSIGIVATLAMLLMAVEYGRASRLRPPARRDLLEACRAHIDAGTRAQLHAAMQAAGTFVIVDPQGDVLQIYAPRPRLAAYLRYTDPAAKQP